MANTLITPQVVANEALIALQGNLVMADLVHRDYSDEFQKVGDTVTIRKPAKFVAKNFFGFKNNGKDEAKTNVIKELTEAVKYCSRVKRGALIVLQKELDKSFYNDVGTVINADVSAELILTIFFPNTPLHDGAMVIHNDKILAAGVLLPLTEDPKLSWRYGTRHRAAIGASEISDSACIVVSEETGDISIAIDGILRKYEDISKFKEDLERIIGNEAQDKIDNAFFQNFLKLRKK